MRYFLKPHKVLFLAHFYLIFFCVTCFFLHPTVIVNYADDNTPHTTNKHLETVLKDLEQLDTLLKWFTDNQANPKKNITSFLALMKKDI